MFTTAPILRAFRSSASASASMAARSFSTSTPKSMARIQVIGRLTTEPEPFTSSAGQDLVRYSIASDYGPSDNRQTSYFRVASFSTGPRKDYLLGIPKGTLVHVDADARVNSYEDEAGIKRSSLSLVQRDILVIRKPKSFESSEGSEPASASQNA